MLMRVPVVAGVLAALLAGMVVYDADASIRRRRGPKEGCPSEYTEINSIEELAAITAEGNYCLMRTLDFQDDHSYDDPILNKATYTTGEGWEPLYPIHHTAGGRLGDLFGLGNEIRNLYINRPATVKVGLFGAMRGGTVKDLTFRDVNIDGGGYTGTLIGRVQTAQPIIIDNIQVINAQLETHLETNDGGRLGGLVGHANGMTAAYYLQVSNILIENATIKDETSRIVGTYNGENLGGIFGFVTIAHTQTQTLLSNALVKDSNITSLNNNATGGVIGRFNNVRINRVVVDNTTIYAFQYAGGFAGRGSQPGLTASIVDIQECGVLDTVDVTGASTESGYAMVGGFIGQCCETASYPTTIARNFSRAAVARVPANHSGAGGFYGRRRSGSGCVDCYYKGTITALGVGTNRRFAGAGGFMGDQSGSSGLIANTYADATIIYDLYKSCTEDWHCDTDQDCRWGQCMPIRYDQWGHFVHEAPTASFGARELPRGAITERVTTSNVTPVYRDNEPGGLYDMSIYVAANWNIVAVEPGTRNTNYIWNMVDGVDSPFLSWHENPITDPAVLDPANALIIAAEEQLVGDGVSSTTITIQARDQYERSWSEGGDTVTLDNTAGSLSIVTDNEDGTYTAILTSSEINELATITGTLNGVAITDTAEVKFTELDPTQTTITAEPTGIFPDGETTSTITVQIVDIDGDAFNTGGDTVTLDNTAGSLSSVTDNEDGTYTAILTSSEIIEAATITGTLNGVAITDTAAVVFSLLPYVDNLRFRLDASFESAITVDGDNRVEQIDDLSGNNHHAAQATVGSRPHLISHNDIQWLDFSQGDHFLTALADIVAPAGRTAYVVGYLPYATHSGKAIRIPIQQYPDYFALSLYVRENTYDFAAQSIVRAGGSVCRATASTAAPLEEEFVMVSRYQNDDQLRIFYDAGASAGNVSIGTVETGDHDGWRIGVARDANQQWFDGYIGEIVVFDEALSDANRILVADYLLDKWKWRVDETTTSIEAVPTSIEADGETTSTITVDVRTQYDTDWTTGGDTVTLATTAGSLSSVTDNEDGTYTATLTSSEINETATITGTLNGVAITDTAEVKFTELDPTQTTITAEPTGIVADGETTSTITVQIVDIDGDAFNTGGDTVTLDNTAGSLSSVTDNEDGTYTAILTSSETPETATITGTLNGVAITDTAEVEFTAP